MSAYYDLFEKPDIRQTGEQQPLYARFVPKGTISVIFYPPIISI